uniref:Uncharacterized protein n=1 Tax=Avena sativa TaxID=4498 RepID=A0ACD5VF99_AVESA
MRPVSLTRSNRSSSAASVGNNGSSQSTEQTKKARTPRRKTEAGNRLEEIDRPLIVPHGILWEKHPYNAREPSTVQGALVRQMYPEPIGPAGEQKPVLCWEDYKWSPGAGVRTAASRIVEEFWASISTYEYGLHRCFETSKISQWVLVVTLLWFVHSHA